MKTVYVETYGCQMNEADSDLVSSLLTDHGYILHCSPEGADAILVNTCAVREHAEERVLGRIGELAQYKHARPDVIIGVLGCMAQHLKDKLLKRSRFIDIVAGPDSYRRLPDLLEQAKTDRLVDVRLDPSEKYDDIVPVRREGISAWLTVQRGCDKVCTFCVVPAVRGRERCIDPDIVVEQANRLVDEGVREITLLGQTVNSYQYGDCDFAGLLERLCQIEGLVRIRYISPYPTDFTERLIDTIAANHKVARHVHLPVQSASDSVLAWMRRRYSIEEFDGILRALRREVPDIAVSTDVIVGFHGETEDDLRLTLEYLERVRFDFAFMFKYSRRSQTAAWRWEEDIAEGVKGERLSSIIQLQERITREIFAASVGRRYEVLVEGPSKGSGVQWFGRTSCFKQVVFEGGAVSPGDLVQMEITGSTGHTLLGKVSGGS